MVTFNLWEKKRIHLVFHNPMISKVKSKLLDGDYDHRRMAYFENKQDIEIKKVSLEKALKDLIKLQNVEEIVWTKPTQKKVCPHPNRLTTS